LDWLAPKPVPASVTSSPALAVDGVIPVIVGVGLDDATTGRFTAPDVLPPTVIVTVAVVPTTSCQGTEPDARGAVNEIAVFDQESIWMIAAFPGAPQLTVSSMRWT
jgi:hypothetical protein